MYEINKTMDDMMDIDTTCIDIDKKQFVYEDSLDCSSSSDDDCFCSFSLYCRCLFLICSFVCLCLDESDEGILFNISISSGLNNCSVSLFEYTCFVFFFSYYHQSHQSYYKQRLFFLGGFVDFCGFSNNVCKSVPYFCFNSDRRLLPKY